MIMSIYLCLAILLILLLCLFYLWYKDKGENTPVSKPCSELAKSIEYIPNVELAYIMNPDEELTKECIKNVKNTLIRLKDEGKVGILDVKHDVCSCSGRLFKLTVNPEIGLEVRDMHAQSGSGEEVDLYYGKDFRFISADNEDFSHVEDIDPNPENSRPSEDYIEIAIIDSGLDVDIENFNHYWTDHRANNCLANISKPERKIGFNFIDNTFGESSVQDNSGHGNTMAYIISEGVANNELVKTIAFKVTDNQDKITFSNIICALESTILLGIKVANCSFGMYLHAVEPVFSSIFSRAKSTTLFVCSAGNRSQDTNICIHEPSGSSATNFNVISVGAWEEGLDAPLGKKLARYSNYGDLTVDVLAKGNGIGLDGNKNKKEKEGTSLAAARVTAIAANLLLSNPNLTPLQLKGKIMEMATKYPQKGIVKYGIIN